MFLMHCKLAPPSEIKPTGISSIGLDNDYKFSWRILLCSGGCHNEKAIFGAILSSPASLKYLLSHLFLLYLCP